MAKISQSGSDTKEKLLILALKYYLKEGAHNTTFQQLANDLGISQAAIYKHYRSRNELLVAAIKYAADKGRDHLLSTEKENEQALNRLKNHLNQNLEFCIDEPIYAIAVITLHYFAACVPEVKKLHEEINERRINRIETYIAHATHEGKLSKINVSESAAMIHSLLMGEMIKAYLWPKSEKILIRQKRLWKTCEKILEIN